MKPEEAWYHGEREWLRWKAQRDHEALEEQERRCQRFWQRMKDVLDIDMPEDASDFWSYDGIGFWLDDEDDIMARSLEYPECIGHIDEWVDVWCLKGKVDDRRQIDQQKLLPDVMATYDWVDIDEFQYETSRPYRVLHSVVHLGRIVTLVRYLDGPYPHIQEVSSILEEGE